MTWNKPKRQKWGQEFIHLHDDKIIDRNLLTRKQHEDLLSTPRPDFGPSPAPPRGKKTSCKFPKMWPPRIDQLALPTIKAMEAVLEHFNQTLEPMRIVRLVKLIHTKESERPLYTAKHNKKEPCKKKKKKRRDKKKECLKVWLMKQSRKSSRLIVNALRERKAGLPNYRQLLVALGLMKAMKLKRKKHLPRYTKQYLMKICEQMAIICDTEWTPYKKIPEVIPLEPVESEVSRRHIFWKMRPLEEEEELEIEVEAEEEELEIVEEGEEAYLRTEPGEEVVIKEELGSIKEEVPSITEMGEGSTFEEEYPDYERELKKELEGYDADKEAEETSDFTTDEEGEKQTEKQKGKGKDLGEGSIKGEKESLGEGSIKSEKEALGEGSIKSGKEGLGEESIKGEKEALGEESIKGEKEALGDETREREEGEGKGGKEEREGEEGKSAKEKLEGKEEIPAEGKVQDKEKGSVEDKEESAEEKRQGEEEPAGEGKLRDKVKKEDRDEEESEEDRAEAEGEDRGEKKRPGEKKGKAAKGKATSPTEGGEEEEEEEEEEGEGPTTEEITDEIEGGVKSEGGAITEEGERDTVAPEDSDFEPMTDEEGVPEIKEEIIKTEIKEEEEWERGEEEEEEEILLEEEEGVEEEELEEEEEKVKKPKEEPKEPEKKKKVKAPLAEIVEEHPPNTVSYLSWNIYSHWLDEFGRNIQTYGKCLNNFKVILEAGTNVQGDKIRIILVNWGTYLKESMQFEKNMAEYFKDKKMTKCAKCGDYTLYNIPKDHDIPNELKQAATSTGRWKRLLEEAEELCRSFSVVAEDEVSLVSHESIDITDSNVATSETSMYVVEDYFPSRR